MQTPMDITSLIIAYEQGDLSQEDTIDMFQELVRSGLAWKLQGTYGRTAARLIEDGLVSLPESNRVRAASN